jgi:hypothetical protein
VDSYTDEHYDITLSIDKDGKPKIERIYGNQRLSDLKSIGTISCTKAVCRICRNFSTTWKHTCTSKSNTYFDITYPYFSQLR